MSLTQHLKEGIACLKPIYERGIGNATQIITVPGNSYIDTRITKSVLKHLARLYGVDLSAMRKNYGEIVGQKNMVPIPFNKNLLMIPLKMRKPITRNDGTTGYINLTQLEAVKDQGENQVLLILKNGIQVRCLMKASTVEKHVRNARIVLQHYQQTHTRLKFPLYHIKDFFSDSSRPATKGDIAILVKEILCIKEKLG